MEKTDKPAKPSKPEARKERPAEERGSTPGSGVRPAGPEAMRMPPGRWSKTDEESDESFPASDPPGNY
jgi:hypothetical protein